MLAFANMPSCLSWVSSARRDLCGGCGVTHVPTATILHLPPRYERRISIPRSADARYASPWLVRAVSLGRVDEIDRGARMTGIPLDDARLVHFAIPDYGWASNRVRLSDDNISALRNLIRRPLLDNVEGFLDALLQKIFAAAVESEMFWRRLRKEGGQSTLCASHRSSLRLDHRPKLGTIVQEAAQAHPV